MKFDVKRASGLFETFAADRTRRGGGDRVAAGLLSRMLEESGYRVARNEVSAQPIREVVKMFASAYGFWGIFFIAMYFTLLAHDSSFLKRIGWVAAAFVWAFLVANFVKRWPDFGFGRSISENIVASHPDSKAPVRVVFFTSLDNPPSLHPPGFDLFSNLFAWPLVLETFASPFPWLWLPLPVRVVLFTLAVGISGVALFVRTFRLLQPGRSGGNDDNRDGLALLAELARTWPKRHQRRIEPVFVAVGSSYEKSGTRQLVQGCLNSWPSKPTLFLGIWSPGLAPPFRIEANNALSMNLAEAAAEGLRIPFHLGDEIHTVWDRWNLFPQFIGLIGENRSELKPESLIHAAQLASEIAIKWGNWAPDLARDQTLFSSRLNSSQKPG